MRPQLRAKLKKFLPYSPGAGKRVLKTMFAYKRTMLYLLKKKGIRAAYNFLFVKLFVREGEGSLGLVFKLLEPLLRLFPQLRTKLAPYPFNIEIEITNKCNKRCIICEHTYWKEPGEDLSFENFKKIVEQFPRLRWVNLTGEGDAFLNKDYLDMIRYLKAKDILVFLVDSFDLINEGIAGELVKMGIDGIWISMDGATKETYERMKVGCNFERTLSNIRNLIKLKKKMASPIPELCFRYVVTKLNVHEMPQFIELIHSLGDRASLGDGSCVEFAGLLVFDEVRELFIPEVPEEILRETMKKAKTLKVSVTFAHSSKKALPPLEYCSAWFEPYIMMGGYVMPCCAVLQSNNRDFLKKHSLGNILEKTFEEIWFSERYKGFREMIPKANLPVPLLCKGCRGNDTTKREKQFGIAGD